MWILGILWFVYLALKEKAHDAKQVNKYKQPDWKW